MLILLMSNVVLGNKDVSLVATMICRDEAVNFRSNLGLWLPYIDYFVFTMDYRNSDDSKEVIANIIKDTNRYKIYDHNFTDFGSARTTSLEQAWESYPHATHILISDPDWKPETDTINKNELDFNHDVFRFKIFDRNGATFRQMDWLLRHRKGLRMKYAIHEVLDIGMYSIKVVNWVLHEIEKPGSWHTKVGHGNSMSFNRYLFDISLLVKEREMYGHDPHTHHYLGITHHAVVENAPADFPKKDLDFHINEAIKYLSLRATAEYSSEFPDERWTGMYALGLLYQNIQNFDLAIKWYKLCSEYDDSKLECHVALTRQYIRIGSLEDAINTFVALMQKNSQSRKIDYLTFFRLEQCNVPVLGIELLLYKIQIYPEQNSVDEIKLVFLFALMVEDPLCGIDKSSILKPDALIIIQNALKNLGLPSDYYKSLMAKSLDYYCNDEGLFNYLHTNNFQIHPCPKVSKTVDLITKCSRPFELDLPASEDMQANFFGEAIGAASIFDIIHFIHGGNATKISSLNRPYRILFAEFFNDKNVYNLLGFHRRNAGLVRDLEITIITDHDRGIKILELIKQCSYSSKGIHVINKNLENYIESSKSNYFDYIEYFGGISKSPNYMFHLASFRKMLTSESVIGLTYFTKNVHQMKIKRLIDFRNDSFHYPFSYESRRLVQQYLEDQGLRIFRKDVDLHNFLAGDIHNVLQYNKIALNPNEKLSIIPKEGVVFTQHEIINIIKKSNLEIQGWLPTAFSQPYQELSYSSIQMFKDIGVDQESFLMNVFPGFRYTVYVTKKGANVAGRTVISEKLFDADAYIRDRSKVIGSIFYEVI